MKNNFILIPGLGFDQQIFKNIKIKNAEINYINWEEPRHREHLEDYAYRISAWIENLDSEPILIGHSFGGILAQEIAKIRPVKKIFLISSIRSRAEMPGLFRAVDWFGLHKFFTKKSAFSTFRFWADKHAYDTDEKKALFMDMVKKQSDNILQWSLKNLSTWQGMKNSNTPILQIHGSRDLTFPYKLILKPDYTIQDGTHLMVFDRADEIMKIISSHT